MTRLSLKTVPRLLLVAGAASLLASTAALAHCGTCSISKAKDAKMAAHEGHDHAGHAHATEAGAHEMDPAMMEAWTKAMTPNENHARLEPLVGDFEFTNTHWMEPGAEPMVTSGTSEHRLILGGRYLHQVYRGDFMGQPFEGHSMTGYDNVQGRYVGTWIDNMGTGIMTSTGTVDPSGKEITFWAEFWDPMTERPNRMREVLTIDSKNSHTLEMYAWDPKTGEEFKAMEIVAKRVPTRAGQ